jgi:hypothetical protein
LNKLTYFERLKFERELRMEGGYVLDFSNRTIRAFFIEVVGVDVYDPRYATTSGSKANRVRAFWEVATDEQLKLFFKGLFEGWSLYSPTTPMSDAAKGLFREMLSKLDGHPKKTEPEQKRNDSASIATDVSERLMSLLIQVSLLPPQDRGFEFEKFLKQLFDAYGLSGRASFRLTGEQIDGSFVLDSETYLLEAKWQNPPIGVADLHTFQGKIQEKAAWSRGLLVSISGFSEEGLIAFGRGKSLICMDGSDLSEMLRRRLSVVEILAAKVRRAAETGHPFTRVRELVV